MSRHWIWLAIALWAGTTVFLLYAPVPFEDLGGDSISPQKVKAGETVAIIRNLRVIRDTPMRVTRSMIKGDCRRSCEIIDLPSSVLTLQPGEYLNLRRDHIIPLLASPGMWRMAFAIHWEDNLGRGHHESLKDLSFEVLDR